MQYKNCIYLTGAFIQSDTFREGNVRRSLEQLEGSWALLKGLTVRALGQPQDLNWRPSDNRQGPNLLSSLEQERPKYCQQHFPKAKHQACLADNDLTHNVCLLTPGLH